MYKKDFDTYLASRTPKAALLYGESDFLIQVYSKKITNALNVIPEVFYYADYSLDSVMNILTQSSLFGDAQVVVLKLDKKLDSKHLKAIMGALKSNENSAIIIEFYQAENKPSAQYARDFKAFATSLHTESNGLSGVVDVRFFTPNARESIDFLRERANSLGIFINNQNLQTLLEMQNNDIALACAELSKFSIIQGEVKREDIAFLCYGLGSVGIEELLERIFSKKSPFLVLEKMLESGLDEMGLMRDMEEYFNKLFLFFAYARANGRIEPKEILGYAPPNLISDEYKRRCLQVRSEEGYLEIFKLLGKWQNELMQGKKSISLQSLIKIQDFIR